MTATAPQMKPLTGQSGPPIDLALEDLNHDERAVLSALDPSVPRTIHELAEIVFKNQPTPFVANYRVRNALRRLPRARLAPDAGFLAKRALRGAYVRGDGLAPNPLSNGTGTAPSAAPVSKAQRPARTRPKRVARNASNSGPTILPTRKQLVARVRELRDAVRFETVPEGEHAQRLALILVALEVIGPSTTAIARLTGHKRGYVIRRLQKVKGRLPKRATPGFWEPTAFWDLVRRSTPA